MKVSGRRALQSLARRARAALQSSGRASRRISRTPNAAAALDSEGRHCRAAAESRSSGVRGKRLIVARMPMPEPWFRTPEDYEACA
jgi:hypothetical protein